MGAQNSKAFRVTHRGPSGVLSPSQIRPRKDLSWCHRCSALCGTHTCSVQGLGYSAVIPLLPHPVPGNNPFHRVVTRASKKWTPPLIHGLTTLLNATRLYALWFKSLYTICKHTSATDRQVFITLLDWSRLCDAISEDKDGLRQASCHCDRMD